MISPRWRKVIRDLLNNKARTILIVLAIAVGIFSFGGILATREIILKEMDSQNRTANSPSIYLGLPQFDSQLVEMVSRRDGVAGAQGKTIQTVKIQVSGQKFNLSLLSYADYSRLTINKLRVRGGNWPPKKGEIFLERASFTKLGKRPGETLEVELPTGQKRNLVIAGEIYDLNTIPPNFTNIYTGYVNNSTFSLLGLPSDFNQLEIVPSARVVTLSQAQSLANNLKTFLKDRGVTVGSLEVRKPGEHWAEDVTRGFVAILTVIGAFSVILSGFLVVNTIFSVLAQQKKQIGIMRSIGAKRSQVVELYLATVLLYGLLALTIAVPIGLGISYGSLSALASFLNVEILNFYLPLPVLLLEIAAAVLIPVLSGLIPIFSGTKMTVRSAIYEETETTAGTTVADKILARIGSLPRPFLLSFRNTFRKRGRLLLTLGTLTLAGMFFISVLNVRRAMEVETEKLLGMVDFDVQLQLDQNYDLATLERKAVETAGVERVEGRTMILGQLVNPDGSLKAAFPISGVVAQSDFIKPTIVSGRWLNPLGDREIVLSSEFTKDNPVRPGDKVNIEYQGKDYPFRVVGIVFASFGDTTAYTNFSDLAGRVMDSPDSVSTLFIRTASPDPALRKTVAANIENNFKQFDIKVNTSQTRDDVLQSIAGRIDFLIVFLLFMATMILLVGALGLTSTMSLNVMERIREIGVMRSVGATNWAVRSVVLVEGLVIGLLSWLLALPLSLPVSAGFGYVLGQALFTTPLPFVYDARGAAIWLAVILVTALVASLLPAQRAVKLSVKDTLSYE